MVDYIIQHDFEGDVVTNNMQIFLHKSNANMLHNEVLQANIYITKQTHERSRTER